MTLQAMQRSLHIDLPLIGHLCHWGGAARLLVVDRLSCREPFSLPGLRLDRRGRGFESFSQKLVSNADHPGRSPDLRGSSAPSRRSGLLRAEGASMDPPSEGGWPLGSELIAAVARSVLVPNPTPPDHRPGGRELLSAPTSTSVAALPLFLRTSRTISEASTFLAMMPGGIRTSSTTTNINTEERKMTAWYLL